MVIRQLIHISAFHKEVRGFLGFGLRQACDISHLGVQEQVLKAVCLIYEQSIHAQFFKGDNIILSGLVVELVEFQLNGAFALFHLLDGEAFCIGAFCFRDTLYDLVELCLQNSSLPFHTHGDLLKLRVSDNDCIVIARGNTGAELFAVSCFKVFLRCHKDIGGRI